MSESRPEGTAAPYLRAEDVPFVGREAEQRSLSRALAASRKGRGSAWLIEGPPGIGKSRLVRRFQESAEREGVWTLWGYGLNEIRTPFFLFQQIFRQLRSFPEDRPDDADDGPLASLVFFEETHAELLAGRVARLASQHPTLWIGRETERSLRGHHPALPASARTMRFSKGESPHDLGPSHLDALGDLVRAHFDAAPESIVAISPLEYLSSQNGFLPVLRLVEYLRDLAEEREGHLLLGLNPEAFERRELTMIEGEGHVVRPPGVPVEAAGVEEESPTHRLIRYIDALERASARGPILIVADDLQWADPDSQRAFQFLARNVRELPVTMLATRRTEEGPAGGGSEPSGLEELLDACEREGTVRRITLGGIEQETARELARRMFDPPLEFPAGSPEFLELYRRAEGNPFFFTETLRQLAEEGGVRSAGDHLELRLPEGESAFLGPRATLPASLQRLVHRRLARLALMEREALQWAAVIGSEFDLPPLEGVIASGEGATVGALERLERRDQLLHGVGPGRWGFSHPLIHEVALADLTQTERARKAERLADWWAEHRPHDVDTLARLYHAAMSPVAGIPWVRRALDGAVRSRALDQVLLYHRWLQELLATLGVPKEEQVGEGLSLAERLVAGIGTSEEVAAILRMMLARSPVIAQRRALEALLANCLVSLDPIEARELLARLRAGETGSPPAIGVSAVMGVAASRLAITKGHHSEADREADTVLSLGEGAPLWTRVLAASYSAQSLARLGRMEEAERRLQLGRALAEPTGEPRLRAACRNSEVILAELAGNASASRHAAAAALALHREGGNPRNLASGMFNLAYACMLEGDLEAARRTMTDFQKHCHRFRDGRHAFLGPLLEGRLAIDEQRWEDARSELQSAAEAMVRSGHMDQLSNAQLELAEAHLGLGHSAQARTELDRLRRRNAPLTDDERHSRLMLEARCDAAEGHAEHARAALVEAAAIARASGNLFNQGMALNHLARWEEAFGDPAEATRCWAEAKVFFDRSGVLREAWGRTWPPPFRTGPRVEADRQG